MIAAYYCHFCSTVHARWVAVADVEAYYREVGTRPAGPIYQCPICLFRIPLAHMWTGPQKDAEMGEIVQEYAQMEMF